PAAGVQRGQAPDPAGPRHGRHRGPGVLPVQAGPAQSLQLVPLRRPGHHRGVPHLRHDPGQTRSGGRRAGRLDRGGRIMAASVHPLDPASAAEYLAGREIMAKAGLLTTPVRFAYYGLEDPAKADVLGGAETDRRLRAYLVDTATGESTDVVVSLARGEVVSTRTLDPAKDGQMPILDSD